MRPVSAALLLGSVGVLTAVACSFPSIGYRDATGGGASTTAHTSTSTTGGEKAATASSSHAGSTVASTSSSGGGVGGSGTGGAGGGGGATSSSSSSSSSGGCLPGDMGTDPCDCDGDGDKANTPECDNDGGDCNDHDPLVSSKQTGWFDTQGSNGWDYNCDGQNEYQYSDQLDCPLLSCDGSTQKWSGGSVPDCGEMGPYAVCSLSWVPWPVCSNGSDQGMRTQGCH